MPPIAPMLAALLLLVGLPMGSEAAAACTAQDTVAPAWAAIDEACPCAAQRGAYLSCATRVLKARVEAGSLAAMCRKDALRHAKLSVCGRPGAAVCCRVSASGTQKHRIVPDAARCTSTARIAACTSDFQSIPTGCSADGCLQPVCGDGVIEGDEECDPPDRFTCDVACKVVECALPPTACGNGVVDAGEACEPPGAGTCDDDCQTAACTAPVPGEIAIGCAAPAEIGTVRVGAAAAADGYMVAWTAPFRRPTSELLARRFDADVAPIDLQVRHLTAESPCGSSASDPAVASDGTAYYATWTSQGTLASTPGLAYFLMSGRLVDAGGAQRDADELAFGLDGGGPNGAEVMGPTSVANAGIARFAASWTYRSGDPRAIIYYPPTASILDFTGPGTPSREPFRIGPFFGDLIFAGAASVASFAGQPLAVYHQMDARNATVIASIGMTWPERPAFNPYGTLTRRGRVVRGRPVVAAGPTSIVVAWAQAVDDDVASPVTQIRGVRFVPGFGRLDPDGGSLLATAPGGVTSDPAIAFDGTVWLIVWTEANGVGHDLRGVAVAADGTILDTPPRLLASGVSPIGPAAAAVGDGRVVVVYGRPDGTSTAIRAVLVPGS